MNISSAIKIGKIKYKRVGVNFTKAPPHANKCHSFSSILNYYQLPKILKLRFPK